jgi:thiamine kinase-like enzyme
MVVQMNGSEDEIALSKPMRRAWLDKDDRSAVYRRGDVVLRETGPWAPSVHAFLRHLERVGFADDGREVLGYIEGEVINPQPWSLEGVTAVGRMLRELHDAAVSFNPPEEAQWPPFHGRNIGGPDRVISHCDLAPWNIVSRDRMPVGLIDWEYAGPIDPLVELAQACWLNVRLFSDDVADKEGLGSLDERCNQLSAMIDAYGLNSDQRAMFFDLMIEFVIYDTAFQADEAGVTSDSSEQEALWGLAWRARSASWMLSNRQTIEQSIL